MRKLFSANDIQMSHAFTIKQLHSRSLNQLIRRGVIVAVVGGDGTLNAVARLLVGTKSVLFPLPGGTFNHFVRDLGMYPTIEGNIEAYQNSSVQKIDVGYVNDELFLNNSNLGLYPFSLIERKRTKMVIGKYAAALLSAFDQLFVFRRHALIVEGKKLRSPFVFVGNNIYDIQKSLTPERVSFNKGILTVMIATSSSRRALVRAILDVLKGDVSHRDDFVLSQATSVKIESRRPRLPVSFDGEVKHLYTPLRYRSLPKSLNVLITKQD
jgi:diacylglycerol kinase family enzyme